MVIAVRLDLAVRLSLIDGDHMIVASLHFNPRHARHTSVNHEPENVLDTVERKNLALNTLPQILVIRRASFNCRAQLVDEFGICHCDLEVRALLISLEAKKVLSEDHLDRLDCGLMLSYLSLEEGLVTLQVGALEVDRGGDVDVVEEVRNMEHDRVARLSMSVLLFDPIRMYAYL